VNSDVQKKKEKRKEKFVFLQEEKDPGYPTEFDGSAHKNQRFLKGDRVYTAEGEKNMIFFFFSLGKKRLNSKNQADIVDG